MRAGGIAKHSRTRCPTQHFIADFQFEAFTNWRLRQSLRTSGGSSQVIQCAKKWVMNTPSNPRPMPTVIMYAPLARTSLVTASSSCFVRFLLFRLFAFVASSALIMERLPKGFPVPLLHFLRLTRKGVTEDVAHGPMRKFNGLFQDQVGPSNAIQISRGQFDHTGIFQRLCRWHLV